MSSSLNPKFLCGDRISLKSVWAGTHSFHLHVLQAGESVGLEYLQMYSQIKYNLLVHKTTLSNSELPAVDVFTAKTLQNTPVNSFATRPSTRSDTRIA